MLDFENFLVQINKASGESNGCIIFESLDTGKIVYIYEGCVDEFYKLYKIFILENSNVIIRGSREDEETEL